MSLSHISGCFKGKMLTFLTKMSTFIVEMTVSNLKMAVFTVIFSRNVDFY